MFKAVPAHKFLILTNQLVARIGASSQDSTFTRSLHNIVSRMVAYHPFHSLLQVIKVLIIDKCGKYDAPSFPQVVKPDTSYR